MSTVPQAAPEHPEPETLQDTERFGLPEPVTLAAKFRAAPSSVSAAGGFTLTVISLATVTVAVALFEPSAWLAAWMVIPVCAGRICGAV